LETSEQQCELQKSPKMILIHNLCLTLEFKDSSNKSKNQEYLKSIIFIWLCSPEILVGSIEPATQ